MGDAVEVGVVARPHGVRGELRVTLHASGSTALLSTKSVLLDGERYTVVSARPTNNAVLLMLDGIDGRDAAAGHRGAKVSVDRSAIDLEPGEILLSDLVGFRVELVDGTAWGEVAEVATGPQDRLIIVDGSIERMLPMVDEFVVEIDAEAGRIVVDPPDGLPESPRE